MMAQIIEFKPRSSRETLMEAISVKSETRYAFLQECKILLTEDDYEELLLMIMDADYYDIGDEQMREITDAYWSYDR
jgi:hypothetical protein